MNKFLILCLLGAGGYFGWRYVSQNNLAAPVKSLPAKVSVSAPQKAPAIATAPIDVLGSAWNEREVGNWNGTWKRRGFTNVFDAAIRDGADGMNKTFVAVVTHQGNAVHVESSHASDGRNCTYDGTISADGTTISGTYTWSSNKDAFTAAIVPVPSTAHEYAAAGTFFLLDYQSLKTASGVTGFTPGTQVQQIADHGGSFSVLCQGQELEVPKGELTNDLAVARDLAAADASEQASLSAKASADLSRVEAVKVQQLQQAENNRNRQVAAAQRSAPVRPWQNPLDRPAYGQTNIYRRTLPKGYGGDSYVVGRDGSAVSFDEAVRQQQAQDQIHDFQHTQIDILRGNIDTIRNNNRFDPNLSRLDSQLMQLRRAAGDVP